MLRKSKVLLADSGKPVKPVVTSGEFGSSEMQTIQTDCLQNLPVPIGQCQKCKPSRILVAFFCSLLVISCFIRAFTVQLLFLFSQNACAS